MYDSTIHAKTVARQFRKTDFKSKVWNATKADRPAIVRSAISLANYGFKTLSFKTNKIGGKTVYRHASLAEALLIRHVSENVRTVTGVKQSDRQSIIKSLSELMKEGVPFNVAKIDIKSFYESIDTKLIVSMLESDAAFSRQSVSVIKSFCERLTLQNIPGLPRGLGVSATLSEYLLREFDHRMRETEGVKFYSRYVDDIIIVSQANKPAEDIIATVRNNLPRGLTLNNRKTRPYRFKGFTVRNTGATETCLSFLGYDISVGELVSEEGRYFRNVKLDIASKKVSRIKRRICKALLDFNNGGSFYDLRDRFKILTCNFGYEESSSHQVRYSGIRYNYGLIEPHTSAGLSQLDQFLLNIITSKHPNNRIRPNLTPYQRQALLGFGFKRGFVDNVFFTFDQKRLVKLVGCWAHA